MQLGRSRIVLSATAAVWALTVVVVAPWLIREGYAGRSISLVNDVFRGRDVHPVDFYLTAYRRLAMLGTAVLGAVAGVTLLAARFPEVRHRWVESVAGRGSPLDPGSVMWYAAAWGLSGGFAQASYLALRQVATQRPAAQFFWELMWMIPVASVGTALLLAVVLRSVARLGRVEVGLETATFVFGFPAVHGLIRLDGIPFYGWAEIVLSLGVTTVLVRIARARPAAIHIALRAFRPWAAASAVALGAFMVVRAPSVSEWWRLRGVPVAEGRPNILLIILDTVRADHLGVYGYERDTTPRIDAWAQTGVVMERAYATAPWTLPSHAAMFTGRYSYETLTSWRAPLDDRYPTLAEELARAGYATGSFVGNLGYTGEMSGLARGFARYEGHRITLGQLTRSYWLSARLASPLSVSTGALGAKKIGKHVTHDFLAWLDRPRDRPFFAFLNYLDAHSPYDPPEPFRSRFGGRSDGRWDGMLEDWERYQQGDGPEPDVGRWVRRYDGGIAYVDHEVGTILDALAERGLSERTLVIVTSDHGEHWGERGLIEHENSVYPQLIHVPLIFSWPGTIEPGVRIREEATLRDLASTILDLAGVREASAIPGTPLDLAGETDGSGGSPRLAELLPPNTDEVWRGLIVDSLEFIRRGDEETVYDLSVEAPEPPIVKAPDPWVLARFRAMLDSLRTDR